MGDAALQVTGISALTSPQAGGLTFARGKSHKKIIEILTTLPKMAVLLEPSVVPPESAVAALQCTLLVVSNPQQALLACFPLFYEEESHPREVHPTAIIHPTAQLGKRVSIGAYCVIGEHASVGDDAILHEHVSLYRNAGIGERSVLHSGVVIREECKVGSDCIIHNHAVIGADGFGYLSEPTKGIAKVPQVGITVIGNHVEIGVGSAIDRAAIGMTSIGDHTKIDNHVQVGHNVSIGSHCIICAQVGIAGSVRIDSGVVLGGASGVADHLHICSGVRVGGFAGVTSSLEEPGDYAGMPISKAGQYRRQQAVIRRLSRRENS
jgi:UDP-3-O-[3-hydroxymyristoyl] glucosamine N-acyltransferase